MAEGELRGAVEAWIADDPDEGDRAELRELLDEADGGAAGAVAELRDRFADRLHFGTAGLRGVVAAGPNRMNRAVVRAATAAVAGWLLAAAEAGKAAGAVGAGGGGRVEVVVGCDARHRSGEFADEVAGVLAGAGIAVHMLPRPCPTPLLAFAVRHLGTAAGIMITASHNPAADNGYKLYLSDGGQVIPPADAEIEKRIAALGPLLTIPVAPAGTPLVTRHGDEVAQAYLAAVAGESGPALAGLAGPGTAGQVGRLSGAGSGGRGDGLSVVYTAMHGVAGQLMLRAMRLAGFGAPHVVAAQAEPDPDFPTVAFPNPEEPGALDLALADARRLGADLVIASDPDGDRLAVAVPEPGVARDTTPGPEPGEAAGPEPGEAGGADRWRVLTGDQVGALLGASLLDWTAGQAAPGERLVASTVVSSTLLSKIAAAARVRYAETLTGFKWIARAADGVPGARFVFGYEEALGYAVGDVVRDKDGFGAALAMLRLAAGARAAGRSVLDVYDELERAHGVHLTSQVTLRTADQAQVMRRLRAAPPDAFGAETVSGLTDLAAGTEGGGGAGNRTVPRADVLIFRLAGGRVVLRPSGTEPKIKCYIEITEPVADGSLAQARAAAAGRLAPLRDALEALLAGGDQG
ncbi:MAG TPA: phospho-sugar mutase [Streptosporangiaceae bacterium]|nr:phospho-sugar mutase [Streptosporangiaceae bacterium]